MTEHAMALILLALYMVFIAHHAILGRRRTRGLVDYYVGGRKMGGIALGISFFATYSSTNSFVGFSGKAYVYGTPWLFLAPAAVIFSFAAWKWIAPRLRHMTAELDSVTIPDFIGFRYNSTTARVLAAAIVLFASFLYMTAVFKGIGNLLQVFLDLPYWLAILLVFLIVMVYTAVGGFISVVRTDALQGIIMLIAAMMLFSGTVRSAGGVNAFFQVGDMPSAAHLFSWDAAMPFPVLIGIIVAGTMKFVVEPRQLSRFYALEDQRAIRMGTWTSTMLFFVVYTLLLPIGIYAHKIIPAGSIADSDLVVPTLLGQGAVFSPLVSAFLFVAMVAAAMSSLDSVLLVMASTCHRDLVSIWRDAESERANLSATRWYVALFALITAVIALNPPGGIVALTAFSGSLYAACFFPAILFGVYSRRGNGAAVILSMLVGVAVLLLWKHLPFAAALHRVFPAMLLSTLVFFAVAFGGKATSGVPRHASS
ncbi:MAG: sodium/solute symporter [candidate division KSB1 bacterium]|nr:sodium/solute symporter [candidate division KSB1 bacterium]